MKRKYIVIMFLFCFMSITSFLFVYTNKQVKKVNYDGYRLRVSVDGNLVNQLPSSGDYYLTDYDCSSKNTVVSWDMNKYQLTVTNGNKKGNVSCYLEFDSTPRISDMEVGSYVDYVGSNGCIGNKCRGENANFVDSEHLGYCGNSSYQFSNSGWRIAYVNGGNAYLISAGATDCVCSNKNGELSSSCDGYVSNESLNVHLDNLNSVSLKYCNPYYVDGGYCNNSVARNINQDDFELILNRGLSISSCYQLQNKKCGYVNDLMDIGGSYWFSTYYHSLSDQALYWNGESRSIYSSVSNYSYGVRPIIKLDGNVIVVGGMGTYDNPYKISNRTFLIGKFDEKKEFVNLIMMGDDVEKMCINVNSAVCTNYIKFQEKYSLNIQGLDDNSIIYVYYKDSNGNLIASMSKEISISS